MNCKFLLEARLILIVVDVLMILLSMTYNSLYYGINAIDGVCNHSFYYGINVSD